MSLCLFLCVFVSSGCGTAWTGDFCFKSVLIKWQKYNFVVVEFLDIFIGFDFFGREDTDK